MRLLAATGRFRHRGGGRIVSLVSTAAVLAVSSSLFFLASLTAAQRTLFSSNVVTLTSSNWQEHVVNNPHMVLVNICREG